MLAVNGVVHASFTLMMSAISTLTSHVLPAHELITLTVANMHLSHSLSKSTSLVKHVVEKAWTSPHCVPYVKSSFTLDVLDFHAPL
jgi:hypothetical protein